MASDIIDLTMLNDPNDDERSPEFGLLSRRAVIGGFATAAAALGSLTIVHPIAGTNLVPFLNTLGPESAYAAEGVSKYSFTVVGADQVGIQILDVSQKDSSGNYLPVKNATVTLTKYSSTSQDKMPSVSDTTDEDGKVILSIASIAFDKDPKDNVFECACAISVNTEKAHVQMRDFSAGLLALEGASGVIIGTHEFDSNDVYLERCTFDDWDVHYSQKTFLRSKHNSSKHIICVHIQGVSEDTEISLEIIDAADKGKKDPTPLIKKSTKTATYNSDKGFAEAHWVGAYLQKGSSECITKDAVILRFEYAGLVEDIEIFVEDVPTEEVNMDGGLIPFTTTDTSMFSISASNDWPCFNGLSLDVMSPHFPLQLSFTPMNITIGVGCNTTLHDPDTGEYSLTGWMKDHKGNIGERYKRLSDRQMKAFNGDKSTNENGEEQRVAPVFNEDTDEWDIPNKTVKPKPKRFLKNFDFNLIARIVANLGWDGLMKDDPKSLQSWSGGLTVEFGFCASGSIVLQTMTAPNIYADLTLSLTAVFAYTAKLSYNQVSKGDPIDCNKMVYTPQQAVSIILTIGLKVSIGVGVRDVFSLSFDSTFTFPIMFSWKEYTTGTWPSPHTIISVTILLEVVFQCFLLRFSAQIYSYKKENWYNNWIDSNAEEPALTGDDAWGDMKPRFRLAHPDGTFRHTRIYSNDGQLLKGSANPFDDMIPVTNDMMLGAHEADAVKIAADDLDEIDEAAEAARFVPVNGKEGIFVRDDGTVVCTNKIPRAYVKEDGSIETELVDCEGANTFLFGEDAKALVARMQAADDTMQAQTADVVTKSDASASAATPFVAAPLVAQSETAVFQGDPMLGFALGATEEYSYKPVPGKTTNEYCGDIGIKGIAANDGVVPNVDAVIFTDVHSDPRHRVVEIGGVPYLFRVVTVSYPINGELQCRTRVVASAYNTSTCTWGDPKVIEYNSGDTSLPRRDTFDYDFDIVVRTGDDPWARHAEACLLVLSGMRPNGDETSVYEACSNPIVSIVLIDANLKVTDRSVRGAATFGIGREHMLCSPCIVDGFADGGASGALAYTFLHRSATSGRGLTTGEATVTAEVGYCFVRGNTACFPDMWKTGPAMSPTSFGIAAVAGDPVKDKYDGLLTLLISRDGGYDVCSATVPPGKTFDQLVIRHNISCDETLPAVQPWPHHGTFLFTKDRPATDDPNAKDFHLYEGTYDVSKTDQKGFVAKQVDTLGMKGASFCVSPSGKYIFYNESNRDKPPENVSAEMQASTDAGQDASVYRIMALRYDNGKFCEDFPFCELNHPIDRIELLKLGKEASSFVITEITNANESLADMHYVSVPNVQAAEIKAFAQVEPFVYADKDCPFQVDIHNHGNMIIGGLEIEMHDPSDNNRLIGTAHVGQIEPKNIRMNASNLGWGNHVTDPENPTPKLTAEEEQGMLMPGKLMSYIVSFHIPSNWSGEKSVKLNLVGAWSPPFLLNKMSAADDEEDVVYYFHEGTNGTVTLHETEVDATLYKPTVTAATNEDTPDEPVDPDEPRESDKTATPTTGDPFGVASTVGMALGGLGALLAGYSARRVQNERAQEETEEE